MTDVRLDPEAPDLDVIATQVLRARKALKKPVVTLDLARMLTSVQINDTMHGAGTIAIGVQDDNYTLLDSGFFDTDENGRLDPIDLNYPLGSPYWWRLVSIDFDGNGGADLTFMERAAVHLMAHRGPVKVSRAKKTRAEFLKSLSDKVKVKRIVFHSQELHEEQDVEEDEKPKKAKKTEEDKKADKDPGINAGDEGLTIAGAKATEAQLNEVSTSLGVANELKAPDRAVVAMVCAGIGESGFKAIMNQGGSPYGGVFQGNVRDGTWDIDDTEGMARSFLKGGKGFQGGGAIALANAHPDWGPGLIAVTVEGSRSNFASDEAAENHYGQWKNEAAKLIEAGGGTSGGGTTYRKQYNFQVGGQDNPRETYWDAMTRLADEVKWALFLDGQHLYFDSEMTLIRQKPVAVIRRDDAAVVDWSFTWDNRQIATEMRLDLVCDPFEFRAGQVFKLYGFGPASTGTSIKKEKGQTPLPGRWLISEAERDRFGLVSSFTLKQPEVPNPEPASELGQRDDEGTGATDLKGACEEISDWGDPYLYGGGHGPKLSTLGKGDRLDCSSSTSLALWKAGLFDGDVAIVSGAFASSYGSAGRGEEWTVWAHGGHVFIQSEGEGDKWRFDTSQHPESGPRLVNNHRSTAGFTPRHRSAPKEDADTDSETKTK